jgi:hypothetical protein
VKEDDGVWGRGSGGRGVQRRLCREKELTTNVGFTDIT